MAGDTSDEELMLDLLLELPEQHSEYCRQVAQMGWLSNPISSEEAVRQLFAV